MYSYRYGGFFGRFGSSVEEYAVGVFDCPRKKLDDDWRAFGFCSADRGKDSFKVVAADCCDSVFARVGSIHDLERAV